MKNNIDNFKTTNNVYRTVNTKGKFFYAFDPHFGHVNLIKMMRGTFSTPQEMTRKLKENWNKVVGKNDDVFIGDVYFNLEEDEVIKILKSLNGKKHLVIGNHDKEIMKNEKIQECFETMDKYYMIYDELDKEPVQVFLSHYPLLEWPGYFRNAYHVFGHLHNSKNEPMYSFIKEQYRMFNGCLDVNRLTPSTLKQVQNNNGRFYNR